ncbi:hypothetical protein PPACK8108_LOCUS15429 [Phakopsora pachyrhizi]|uniref:Uncharacterized protein n=1 Tax=Phakopsora pachyrhizi TaxID=170000 RepID=A0AAV0B6D6_PHAPC|nr:hypothetical protein PPACK8108_LOCUS15429 [Phakopsora pachyrhizi]
MVLSFVPGGSGSSIGAGASLGAKPMVNSSPSHPATPLLGNNQAQDGPEVNRDDDYDDWINNSKVQNAGVSLMRGQKTATWLIHLDWESGEDPSKRGRRDLDMDPRATSQQDLEPSTSWSIEPTTQSDTSLRGKEPFARAKRDLEGSHPSISSNSATNHQ